MAQHCCWLDSFVIFQGFRTSIAKKPYIFAIFQGGGGSGPPVPSSGSTHKKCRSQMHSVSTYKGYVHSFRVEYGTCMSLLCMIRTIWGLVLFKAVPFFLKENPHKIYNVKCNSLCMDHLTNIYIKGTLHVGLAPQNLHVFMVSDKVRLKPVSSATE